MFRKVLYLTGLLVVLALVIFIYREVTRPAPLLSQSEASGVVGQKLAMIRLEDVSPGAYDTKDKLGKLEAIADYLYKEGIPFHVSLIPFYKNPKNNVEISIGDTDNPHVLDFIKTIKYMQEKGGMIGLHGYTHQYLSEVTGSGYEFMDKGALLYAQPAYAEERVKKALDLMDKAGIPVYYWETPHYTGTLDQYKVLGNYFGLIYDPNPREKAPKNMSSWDSTGLDNQSIIFVPAPLLNISGEKDVDRILNQLDKNDSTMLASFFFHPCQEFRSMYKMKSPQGYEFYVHENNSYLHRLINGFKERGYKFVTVYDVIGFLPAQRIFNLSPTTGKVLLNGDFDGDGRSDLLTGDPVTGCWLMARSQIDRALPRNNPQSFSPPEEWLSNWGQGGSKEFALGDFNGDGKKDLVFWDRKTGEIQVALSDGNKLVPQQQPWGRFNAPEGTVKMFTGCFNNNNKEDLLFWVQGEKTAYVMICNGNGFSPAEPWLENWPEVGDLLVLAGDFNGDGKKDLAFLNKPTGTIQVALSNGSRLIPCGDTGDRAWITNFATGDKWQVLVGNFDGDGIDDFAAYDSADGKWEFTQSAGGKFLLKSYYVTYGKEPEGRALVADFNGDKKFDLAIERHFSKGQTPIDVALSVINNKSNESP